jgi:indole-3-glycerol phosphate synthase
MGRRVHSLQSIRAADIHRAVRGITKLMNALNEILDGVRADLAARQRRVPLERLKAAVTRPAEPNLVMHALTSDNVSVIAEVKCTSPSKRSFASKGCPTSVALEYEAGGAQVISVLTESRQFGGCLKDLAAVRAAVHAPLLCRDFVIASYQLWEARAYGADIVSLIVAALAENALVSLVERAESIGLVPLVEVHTNQELSKALDAGAKVIGVNARNLSTLEVDRDIFARLAPHIPDSIVKVAESGVRGPHDLLAYAVAGADAVLVGQSLAIGNDPRSAVACLVAAGSHPALLGGRE